jgi:hypothetical protein
MRISGCDNAISRYRVLTVTDDLYSTSTMTCQRQGGDGDWRGQIEKAVGGGRCVCGVGARRRLGLGFGARQAGDSEVYIYRWGFAKWVVLLGHVTHRAVTSHGVHMSGQTGPPDGWERRPKHGPLACVMPGTVHNSSGRVMLGLGPIPHVTCWTI